MLIRTRSRTRCALHVRTPHHPNGVRTKRDGSKQAEIERGVGSRSLDDAMEQLTLPGRAPRRVGQRRWMTRCRTCGIRFVAGTRITRHCSDGCRDATRRLRQRHIEAASVSMSRPCESCLALFAPSNARHRFCGDACRNRAWRDQNRVTSPRRAGCAHCRQRLDATRAGKLYCSAVCRAQASRRQYRRDDARRDG